VIGGDRRAARVPAAGWALASGAAGVAAGVLLLLFYVTERPWQQGDPSGWFGKANDYLTMVQFAALIPVVSGLGGRLAGDRRARRWTRVGLGACVGVIVLQLLLVTGVLDFAVQGPLVSLCAVTILCWVGGISAVGDRTRTLPRWLARFGRLVALGVPVALGAFLLGAIVTWAAHVSWGWAAGGVLGFVVWLLLPVWTLLLAGARTDGRGAGRRRYDRLMPRKRPLA
jgi:hypothetical protein